MAGGLMQLVAYGAQDIYLSGNPQITFFKVVYRRHTNFSMETIEQTFNGNADFGKRVTATISRNGDLVCGMNLEMKLSVLTDTGYGIGNACIKTADLEIGGQLIDRHYGEWMNIWGELSTPAGKLEGWDQMVGNTAAFADDAVSYDLDVPLQFWFCRNPGLALPLIALQYHEVKLIIEFRPVADIKNGSDGTSYAGSMTTCKLYVDYVYLDTDERRRFAQVSHEYLIEQLQFTGDESITATGTKKIDLNFNHPCKELIWVFKSSTNHGLLNFAREEDDTSLIPTMTSALLQLNGHDRMSEMREKYFLNVQPYRHHTRVARHGLGTLTSRRQQIYVYSFALKPEDHQPSGTCNFSRIDNAVLTVKNTAAAGFEAGVVKVYAVNYNVLRIMSGMGGLAYSN
jgi:hypothetical protein